MGLFAALGGIGWLTLVLCARVAPSLRGLESFLVPVGIEAAVYGVVLLVRSRRQDQTSAHAGAVSSAHRLPDATEGQ